MKQERNEQVMEILAEHRENIQKNGEIAPVKFHNCLNYGAVRIAVKKEALLKHNLSFSEKFGGGAPFSAGEDTLFICDMLKSKMKLYTYPAVIASVKQEESTWFHGYDEKYLYDKGALFTSITKVGAPLLCLQDLVRHPKLYKEQKGGFLAAFGLMCRGMRGIGKNEPYTEK